MSRSLLTFDPRAVAANLAVLRGRHGGDVWAVVKADGYGHGAVAVARAALDAGAIGAAVATLGEARRLRAGCPNARILILSPLGAGEERDADGFEVVVSTVDCWARVRDRPGLAVHVKVDTGMGRWGLAPREAIRVGREVATGSGRLAGLMSHLATSEERDTGYAEEQIAGFRAVASGFPPCPRHLANSGGALYLAGARFDEARCGIAIYGISPRDDPPAADALEPALRWHSEVRAIRTLAVGGSSGYGRRIVADRPLRLALVPVGYADGYPRRAAGTARAIVRGRLVLVGAVAMDQLALVLDDDHDVAAGDEVALIGRDRPASVTVSDLARAAGTIGYEIACGLRSREGRDERVIVDG